MCASFSVTFTPISGIHVGNAVSSVAKSVSSQFNGMNNESGSQSGFNYGSSQPQVEEFNLSLDNALHQGGTNGSESLSTNTGSLPSEFQNGDFSIEGMSGTDGTYFSNGQNNGSSSLPGMPVSNPSNTSLSAPSFSNGTNGVGTGSSPSFSGMSGAGAGSSPSFSGMSGAGAGSSPSFSGMSGVGEGKSPSFSGTSSAGAGSSISFPSENGSLGVNGLPSMGGGGFSIESNFTDNSSSSFLPSDFSDEVEAVDVSSNYYVFPKYKFGGNQSDVPNLIEAYLNGNIDESSVEGQKAKLFINLINLSFPNVALTDTEILSIAMNFAKSGCSYIAVANAFTDFMCRNENGTEVFYDKIGFDLFVSDSNTSSCNVEALALDIYLRQCRLYYNNIEDIVSNGHGVFFKMGNDNNNFNTVFMDYFLERGIGMEVDISKITTNGDTLLNDALSSKHSYRILAAAGFDLEYLGGDISQQKSYDSALSSSSAPASIYTSVINVGPHAVLITDLNEDGIEVSSWSKRCLFKMGDAKVRDKCWAKVTSFDFRM